MNRKRLFPIKKKYSHSEVKFIHKSDSFEDKTLSKIKTFSRITHSILVIFSSLTFYFFISFCLTCKFSYPCASKMFQVFSVPKKKRFFVAQTCQNLFPSTFIIFCSIISSFSCSSTFTSTSFQSDKLIRTKHPVT